VTSACPWVVTLYEWEQVARPSSASDLIACMDTLGDFPCTLFSLLGCPFVYSLCTCANPVFINEFYLHFFPQRSA
jgi:hypothetical protein